MSFEATFIAPGSLHVLTPKTLPSLFSAARSEFYRSNSHASPFMQEVTAVFSHIAEQVYGTEFFWSVYNKNQWQRFVASLASSVEGGLCMFSCEAGGDYAEQEASVFKGIGLGVPTGIAPYSLWVSGKAKLSSLQSAIASLENYSLDLVSDP